MDKLTGKLVSFGKKNKACMALALLCVFFLYAFAVIRDNAKHAYKALRGNAGRRIAAAALSACMVFTLLPTAAFAAEGETTLGASGVVLPLITGFAPLDEAIHTQRVGADDLVLPPTLLATVDGEEIEIPVTWDGLDAVNEARKSGGLCVLTANVGEGYRLAEGVTAPTISAMILGMGRILGAGTEANPLQLRTEEQLREIAVLTNAGTLSETVFGAGKTDMVYIKLMNDLDISGSQWTPIGTVVLDESSGDPDFTKVFNGVFDGNGNTIKGLTIDDADAMVAGLFGVTATGSEVKNLTLTEVSVSGGMLGAGGVAGCAMGDISGCSVSGSVTSSASETGGVVASAMGDINACAFSGNVAGNNNVGGVAGDAYGAVSKCYSTGSVTGKDSVGGVVGDAYGAVSNCYSTATVKGSDLYVGGVAGSADGAVSNCYATGTVSGKSFVGGVVGAPGINTSVINCAALNPSVSATDPSYGAGRVCFASNGADCSDNIAFAGMTVVNGTSNNGHATYHGADITDLATLKAAYQKDGNNTTSTVFDDTTVWNTFDGTTLPTLVGVGPQTLARPAYLHADGVSPFDGAGTEVDPYQIATAQQLRELARLVNSGDTTYNASGKYFKLTDDLDISGSEWTPIGNDSNNFDANFDGDGKTITGLTINQPTMDYVGLFGYAADTATIQNLGVINVSVVGNDFVGGVVGCARNAITNCYSTGNVTGTRIVGGVAGYAGDAITNCYSTGSVTGTDYVGGVAGSTSGAVSNCVALNPTITATDSNPTVGRVASSGTISGGYAYAGMKVNGATVTGGAANNTNGANITDLATLDGKFTDANGWSAFTAETLPTFKSVEANLTLARPAHLLATPFKGTGTQADPYQISTADQLRHLGTLVNGGDTAYNAEGKWFKLTADLDISGSEWTPIGNDPNQFAANFDGDGKTITGLTINQPTMNYVGLFGFARGTIQNLGVINVSVTGKTNVGGVVGTAMSNVSNCYATGSVTGTGGNVGGVVGGAVGAVSNCYATSSVTGTEDMVGGVVGNATNITVSNCYATGSVTGTGGNVGGVVGGAVGTVTNCVALNPSITATGSDVGRVKGNITGTCSGGYAFAGMTVDGAVVTGGIATDKNGADVAKADLKTASWWKDTAQFPEASWVLADNNLPTLKTTGGALIAGQKVDVPVFLTELPPPLVVYAITKTTATNGSFTVRVGTTDVTQAAAGDTVKIAPWPGNGYKVDTVTVVKTSDSTVVTVTNNTFTMPAYPVTISVSFKALTPAERLVNDLGSSNAALEADGTTVTLLRSVNLSNEITIYGNLTLDIKSYTINGKNSSGSGSGRNGDNALSILSGADVTITGTGSIKGGKGGIGNTGGLGKGGTGGNAIKGDVTLSGSVTISGGDGGIGGPPGPDDNPPRPPLPSGNGGTGGNGVLGDVTLSGNVTITGGNGGDGNNDGSPGVAVSGTITAETDTIIKGGTSSSSVDNVVNSGSSATYQYIKSTGTYAITKTNTTNGSFTVKLGTNEVTKAAAGDTVTITPTANSDYEVDAVTVTKTGESDPVTVTNNSFTMPAYPVTVTVTFEADAPAPTADTENRKIYANGAPLILAAGNPIVSNTVIYIDNNRDGVVDSGDAIFNPLGASGSATVEGNALGSYTVYGGAAAEDFTGNTTITMLGGKINILYGGGQAGAITGNTYVTAAGGTVSSTIYGGGQAATGTIKGNTNVTVSGATVSKMVYGGGYGGEVTQDTHVIISDGTVLESVYGGGTDEHATVTGNTHITISGGAIGKDGSTKARVYGGGWDGTVKGNSNISVTGGSVKASIYGGGNGSTAGAPVEGNSSVAVTGGEVLYSVYGGGRIDRADVKGTKTVTVGGGAKVGSPHATYAYGIAITSTTTTGGVDSFSIADDLTGQIQVVLPASYTTGVIATDAVAGDVTKITLVGGGTVVRDAYLDGTQIKVKTSYAITKANTTNGSFTVKVGANEVTQAAINDTVTITPTAENGYEVDAVTVTKTGASDAVTVTNNTFTMPAYPVMVTVTFKATADRNAVTAAKNAVVDSSVTVAFGANQTAKTAAVQTYVDGLLSATPNAAGVTATVTHTSGNSYLIELGKGSVTDSKTITMTVNVAPDPDIATIAAAKAAAEDATYTATTQAATDTEAKANTYVQDIATTAVNNSGVTVTVNKVSYTEPIAGDAADPDGTNGSYVFTVTVSKGAQSDTTEKKTLTITATAFTGITDVQAVAAAKAAIESALINLEVSNTTTAQDILDAANGVASNGVTVVWDSANDFAKTDATADAPGSITGSLKLTLNSETATVAVNKTIPKLTATTYTVTLDANGGSVSPTSLSVAAGNTATLPTPTRSGSYHFDGWFTAPSGGTQHTGTTPINSNVTLYAHWTYTGGSSGDSFNIVVTPPTPDKPNAPTESEITLPGKVDASGNATATIIDKAVSEAIKKAEDVAKKNGNLENGITLVLNVDTGSKTATSFSVNLPRVTQETIISKKIVNTVLVVNNPDIQIGIDLAAVKEINTQAKADVSISATRIDNEKLTGEAKTAIGNRPAFDLTATYQNGSKRVTDFGGGSVSVALPYTLQEGEVPGGLFAVYVDEGGKVSYITNSSYDVQSKVLRFATNHFSVYGIGYKTPAAFTDIANHWAKADIEFVANRGLMNGTSNTTFSPNGSMTRGMFVTVLGRLAGIDSTKYTNTKFTDVKADAYYAPYVAWAMERGITVGTSATTFAPDDIVTRQEMAVFMSRYAKAMNYKVPATCEAITFADNSSIGSWAAAAVGQMQMAGVLSGKDGNKFDPTGTATRGEIAAVLRRYVELVIDPATAQGA